MTDLMYFGCRAPNAPGHFLCRPGMKADWSSDLLDRLRDEHDTHLDTGYLKAQRVQDVPGRAAFVHVNGHSIVTWWDRSGDSRSASNSAFILPGDHTPHEVMEQSTLHFPEVLEWQTADITPPDGTALYVRPAAPRP